MKWSSDSHAKTTYSVSQMHGLYNELERCCEWSKILDGTGIVPVSLTFYSLHVCFEQILLKSLSPRIGIWAFASWSEKANLRLKPRENDKLFLRAAIFNILTNVLSFTSFKAGAGIFFSKMYWFIYFWLHWVFAAASRLSLVVASSCSSLAVMCQLLTEVTSLVAAYRL